MEVTERPPRPHAGAVWALVAAVAAIALIVGLIAGLVAAPWLAEVPGLISARLADLAGEVATLAHEEKSSAVASPAATATLPSEAQRAAPAVLAAPGDEPYVAVVNKVGPAVVTVVNQLASSPGPFRSGVNPEALGSGVIIDSSGHIVTNSHVVSGGSAFQVIFSDGRKVTAELVGRDELSDVAVLKVGGPVPAVASFGDSSQLQVGQRVVAIGSALGDFRNTVTHGIVSGLDRSLIDQGGPSLTGLIQTDAPINHGNSGGPLLNLQGQVIGLNTAVVRSSGMLGDVAEGLGFAIPSNTVKRIADELIKNGFVARPFLGVSWSPVSPQIASYYGLGTTAGALIQAVQPNSPASAAGLRPGDVVTAVDGAPIDEQHDFATVLMSHKIGETVKLTVIRGRQTLTLSAKLTERPRTMQ